MNCECEYVNPARACELRENKYANSAKANIHHKEIAARLPALYVEGGAAYDKREG